MSSLLLLSSITDFSLPLDNHLEVFQSIASHIDVELATNILNPHVRLICYSGVYANRSRGARRSKPPAVETKAAEQKPLPTHWKRQWQQLLRRVFHVILTCPYCDTEMKVLAVITQDEPIHKILAHLKSRKIDPRDRTIRRTGGVRQDQPSRLIYLKTENSKVRKKRISPDRGTQRLAGLSESEV